LPILTPHSGLSGVQFLNSFSGLPCLDIVVLNLSSLNITPHGKGRWKNNTSIYLTPHFQSNFQTKWQQWRTLQHYLFQNKTSWWIHIKKRIKNLNITHAKIKRSAEHKQEDALTRQVDALHKKISTHPNFLPIFYQAQKQLQQLKQKSAQQKIRKSKADLFENNDRGTKEFFQQFCTSRYHTTIASLKDTQGQNITDPQRILLEVQQYYQSLYAVKPTLQEAQNFFLNNIQQTLDPSNTTLMSPISPEEIHHTILQMANGKSPGPDGLTIEFYKIFWHTIAQDFTEIINEMHKSAHIPQEMKFGTITLIHKKGDADLLKNYRPISLLNVDLKIYTKVLANRLKKILPKILHNHQYAQPSGQTSNVLTLLRDIYQHAHNRQTGHFFLSLDFEKAFDSIDHKWLFAVMGKLGLPQDFIRVAKTLHTDASSEVIVNGFRTPIFNIQRGVRQGDPLSLFLFLIALEPLLATIQNNRSIKGMHSPGRFEIKTLSYADDVTIIAADISSVTQVFLTLQKFESAATLKLNFSKTHGLTTSINTNKNALPPIQWTNQSLDLLGCKVGAHESIASMWDKCLRKLKASAQHHTTFFLSWHAKVQIVKSKMLPLVTYPAAIYPLPSTTRKRINTIIERYMTGHRDTTLPITTLALPLNRGGYNLPDISLYCNIFFLQPIIYYIKHRLNLTPATAQTAMVEYHIGLQLSKHFDLPYRNSLPHISRPNIFYANALALIRKYKLTLEQLYKSSKHQLYQSIIETTIPHSSAYTSHIWRSVHNPILSNHMKSLNYRIIHRILPMPKISHTATLDPTHMCHFCKAHAETLQHTLLSCEKIKPVWSLIRNIITKLGLADFPDFSFFLITQFQTPLPTHPLEDHTIYLFSLAKQKIWHHRNELDKNQATFSSQRITTSIKRAIHQRLSLEKRRRTATYLSTFEQLNFAITQIP